MGSCVSACVGHLLAFTKSWPIKRQMLCFYSLSLLLSLLMIFSLTLFNLLYLREGTLQEIEETCNSQIDENLRDLVTQGAASMGASFTSVVMMFSLIQGVLNTREDLQGPKALSSYEYADLPEDCLQHSDLYGAERVCFNHSSVLLFGAGSQDWLRRSSKLDYVFPHVLRIHTGLISRLLLYFGSESDGFLRVFPGCDIPADYNVTAQPWYQALKSSGQEVHGSPPYSDLLGNKELIMSHSRILRDREGRPLAIASADTPVSFVNRSMVNISSFDTARVFIASLDGSIIQIAGYQPLSVGDLKTENPEFWKSVLKDPLGVRSLNLDGNEFKVATSPLGEGGNIAANWWYVLMVLVEKSEVLHDMEPTREEFAIASLWLLLITAGCSILTGAAVVLCVLLLERQVTQPLDGIVQFSKKISENVVDEETKLSTELEDLREGQSQVASLVIVFKSLMRSLLDTRERSAAPHSQTVSYYSYPLNHLYGGGARWKAQLASLNKS